MSSLSYDANGDLRSSTDALGRTTALELDTFGRTLAAIDPLNHRNEITYEVMGRVATTTDPPHHPDAAERRGYQYDALNRVSLTTYSDGSTVTPTYDAGSRMTALADTVSGTIGRSYDSLDRLTQEQTPQGIVNYTYDNAGRRATMTPSSQAQIS